MYPSQACSQREYPSQACSKGEGRGGEGDTPGQHLGTAASHLNYERTRAVRSCGFTQEDFLVFNCVHTYLWTYTTNLLVTRSY